MRVCPFISYAKEDAEAAKRLYEDLLYRGARPWLDAHNLRGGDDWPDVTMRALRLSSHVIVLISKNSVEKRGFVQREVRKALELLEDFPPGTRFVIPVRLDESEPLHDRLGRIHRIDLFNDYDDGIVRLASTLGLPRRAAAARSGTGENQDPRIFVSYTAHDEPKIAYTADVLRANGLTAVMHQLERVVQDDSLLETFDTCGAFLSLNLKRNDFKVAADHGERFVLPPFAVAEELLAWTHHIGMIVRVSDVAVDDAPYNLHVPTFRFSTDADFFQAVDAAVAELRRFFYGDDNAEHGGLTLV